MLPRLTIRISLAAVAAWLAVGVAGASAQTPEPPRGGSVTMLAGSDVDFLDPGRTYYTFGYVVALATNRPLYSFKPGDALHPVPDLAAADPQVSPDQKTVTVAIRPGVRFAPPVNREVVAGDVKYAFERFFSRNVGGQYPGYFSVIKGAPSRPTRGVRRISGIATPDPHTLVFSLKKAAGVSFAASLVMPITAPVPAEYARRYDAHNPSTYEKRVVATGPYRVSGYKSGKSITLSRNPNWAAATDYRPAYLDSIVIRTDQYNSRAAAQKVASGRGLLFDATPPSSMLRAVQASSPSQLSSVWVGGFRSFSLNTEVKPFNDLNVRKAVLAGFNRVEARQARGGELLGDIATHFLPPDFPGFDQAGGAAGFPDLDYFNQSNITGNPALAQAYMKKAGYKSGKYTGKHRLLLVGANVEPNRTQIRDAARQLGRLGIRTRVRLVPQDSVYNDWCQVRAKKVAMCGAGWFKDFADPQPMLEPVFRGSLITNRGINSNLSLLDDPKVDAAMDAAAGATGDDRLRQWAAIDKQVLGDAAAIPYLWDRATLLRSANVTSTPNPYTSAWDLSFTAVAP